jgi:hypothetical protein
MSPRRAQDTSMVLDLPRGRMWIADSGRRLYWEGTAEEYCEAARGVMAAAQRQLAEDLKSRPKAQREQMQQMTKSTTPPLAPLHG